MNFIGQHAWVGVEDGITGVGVTEWSEPQAVIGSDLHRLAYPEEHERHLERGRKLEKSDHHGGGEIRSLQLRGEYLYTAGGSAGFRVYDVANIYNKGFSEKIVTAPVSPLGQDTHVSLPDATAVASPRTTRSACRASGGPRIASRATSTGATCRTVRDYRYVHHRQGARSRARRRRFPQRL